MSIGILFTPEEVHRLAPEVVAFDLKTMHEVFDSKLQWLVQKLVDETQ